MSGSHNVPSVQSQADTLRQWMADAAARTYGKRDKRRYAVLSYDGQRVTLEPTEALQWVLDGEGAYTLDSVFLTMRQFEKLPEFTGF